MKPEYRVLVVEDDTDAREATVQALQDEGFLCEWVCDGEEAAAALGRSSFDLVVTDLKMPKRHGHALATDLIGQGQIRPLVAVLTGLVEPRLVKDLIARGVDEVAFKPVNLNLFGAKLRALCARRDRNRAAAERTSTADGKPAVPFHAITAEEMNRQLDAMAGKLPVSNVAIAVVSLIQSGSPSAEDTAAVIAGDALLTMEVLRLANSARGGFSGMRICDLSEAIVQLGNRQVCELALALTTVRALKATTVPWINPDLTSRRCVASSVAIKLLQRTASRESDDEGMALAALLLPASRLVLSLAFPELYRQMTAYCVAETCSLAELERHVFPLSPSRAMAGVLARWKLSPRLWKPLRQAGMSYAELSKLREPLRSKTERLRIAELVGQMAVGRFAPWDEIDFPPPEALCRLRADDLDVIIDSVRYDLAEFQKHTTDEADVATNSWAVRQPEAKGIRYFKLSADPRDCLASFVQALGVNLERITRHAACQSKPVLVNGMNVSPERLELFLDDTLLEPHRSIVTTVPLPSGSESWGPLVQLPCCFAQLSIALKAAALLE